ncbi:hypothetical protein SRHO_G00338260 [Serrasalmus rhombeus]
MLRKKAALQKALERSTPFRPPLHSTFRDAERDPNDPDARVEEWGVNRVNSDVPPVNQRWNKLTLKRYQDMPRPSPLSHTLPAQSEKGQADGRLMETD